MRVRIARVKVQRFSAMSCSVWRQVVPAATALLTLASGASAELAAGGVDVERGRVGLA